MTVDWKKKKLVLTTASGPALLVGHATTQSCATVNSTQLMALCNVGALSHAVQFCLVAEDAQEE